MEIGEAVGRYEQAAALLPSRWQQAARRVPEHRKAQAEEFRLRAGRPMTLLTCEGELLVSDELPRQSVTQADLEQLCDAVTGYSRYAAAETMGITRAKRAFTCSRAAIALAWVQKEPQTAKPTVTSCKQISPFLSRGRGQNPASRSMR